MTPFMNWTSTSTSRALPRPLSIQAVMLLGPCWIRSRSRSRTASTYASYIRRCGIVLGDSWVGTPSDACLHRCSKYFSQRVLLALDFLHKECQLVHTGEDFPPHKIALMEPLSGKIDIKADNIMFEIGDNSVFEEFEKQELASPGP